MSILMQKRGPVRGEGGGKIGPKGTSGPERSIKLGGGRTNVT